MRQLFAWTPLGTEVIIRDGDARSWPEQEIHEAGRMMRMHPSAICHLSPCSPGQMNMMARACMLGRDNVYGWKSLFGRVKLMKVKICWLSSEEGIDRTRV